MTYTVDTTAACQERPVEQLYIKGKYGDNTCVNNCAAHSNWEVCIS
jgi:hypothetical protein